MFYSDGNLTPPEADKRVAVGSAYITAELGEGWVSKVDQDTFDIMFAAYCIAPMVFDEDWDTFQLRFGTVYEMAEVVVDHGFDVYCGQREDGQVLNEAWKREFNRLSA